MGQGGASTVLLLEPAIEGCLMQIGAGVPSGPQGPGTARPLGSTSINPGAG